MSLPKKSKFISIQEAAVILSVSTKTLRRWEEIGKLVPKRTKGNHRRYAEKDIREFKNNYSAKLQKSSPKILESPNNFGFKNYDVAKVSPDYSFTNSFGFIEGDIAKKSLKPVNLEKIRRYSSIAEVHKLNLAKDLGSLFEKIGVLQKNTAIASFLILLLIGASGAVVLKNGRIQIASKEKIAAKNLNNQAVLGESVLPQNYIFRVNVPGKFYEDADFLKNLTVTGDFTASNVLYGLTGGGGISITEGQNPIITNTDLGSSQKIFKTIKIGDTSFSAGSNSDTLTLTEGTNVSLSMDTTNKKVTINSSNTNVSGWTDDGTTVRLSTSTDKVGIGTTAPTNTLDIAGTLGVSGAASLSSTLNVLGATTLAPTTNGSTTTLTLRAANNSTGNILDITNTGGTTSYLSIDNNGSLTVGGSTLTNAGLLESSGAIHLTNASNTIVGTAILGGWTMNSNTYTYRRAIIVTNTSASTLPKNYQITVNLSSSASNQVYANSQTASPYNDFRIAWDNGGSITEAARNVSSFTSSNVSVAFQLQGNISAGGTDTYYIYYSNSALASISAAYSSYTGDTQLDSADSITNWETGDSINYALSLETTIKQEGTGSVKSAALTGNIGTLATTNQGQLPQTLKNLSAVKASISGSDYLYVLGGNNGASDQTTVYKATINGSGNIGTLATTNQGQLPQALSEQAAVTTQDAGAVDSGTGADGALDLTTGAGCSGSGLSWSTPYCYINPSQKNTFNFTTINIPSGKILLVNGATTSAVTIKATGSVTVVGTIDVAGKGYTTPNTGPGAGVTDGANSYGGAGHSGAGGNGHFNGGGGGTYATITPGSSSNGGSGESNGGGAIVIKSGGQISVYGGINASGTGAGASGGYIGLTAATSILNGGYLYASGSAGQDYAFIAGGCDKTTCSADTTYYYVGGGGGGNIVLTAPSVTQGQTGVSGGSAPATTYAGANGVVSNNSNIIFVLGGINGSTRQTTVYRSALSGSDLGAFSTTNQGQLPVALTNLSASSVTISNTSYLYVLGGNSASGDVSTVYKATISNGDIGAFSTTSQGQLPQTLSEHSSQIVTIGASNYIYVLGGLNGATAQSTVYKATIDGSGNIGTLSTISQTQLPTAIYDASSFMATIGTTNYIYLVGGKNSAGNPVNTIYRGTLDASGNVTAWTVSGTLPQSISSAVAVTSSAGGSNSLYLIGGANSSAISTTYKALINDMSGFTLTKTLTSAVDLSNKNNIQFGFYSSQTGSFNAFEFSEDNATWTQCANNSDFSSGTFVVNSANTWETKTCDISSVSNASKNAVLYFRTRVSSNQTSNFTTYIDNIQGIINVATISNTFSFAQAVLGASDLNLNAQGSGVVKVNYDATNGLAGTGGLVVYNGSSSALLTVSSNGFLIPGVTNAQDIGSSSLQWANIYGQNIYSNGILLQNLLQRNNGALAQFNLTDDFLLGSVSTASAKFSFTGLSGNQTQASFSGQFVLMPNNGYGGSASLSGQLVLGAFSNATIQTTNNKLLILGGNTTGDIQFKPGNSSTSLYLASTGRVGVGINSPTAILDVGGTASLGGQLTFRSGVAQVQSTADQTLTIGGDTTGQVVLSGFNGALNGIKFAGYTTAGCTLKTTTTGIVQCGTDNIGVNWWNQLAGALLPVDITNDFLLGGQSTASAKFSITGIVTNKPIASLSGNLIVMPNNGWGGNVAIGATTPNFRLDVTDLQNATVSAMITNSSTNANAGVLALKVGNTTPALTNYFTSFLNGNGAIVGKIQGNGSGGVTYSTSGVDFAEYFKKENSSEILNPGDIVCLGATGGATKCIYNNNILGVISDKAGFIGGGEHDQDPNYVAVGLVGQLKVNVSSESGRINPGDSLTVDSRGFATKANTSGQIVGQALEEYSGLGNSTVLIRINITWYQPAVDVTAFLNNATNATISANFASAESLDIKNATISSLMILGKATVKDLGITGVINSGLLVINGLDDSVNGNATINTLAGDLYIQNQVLGGIDILAGKIKIDTMGNINIQGVLSAESIETSNFTIKGTGNIGSAIILKGQTQVQIITSSMHPASKVFITPTSLASVSLSVVSKQEGKFIVQIPTAQTSDIKFDWFIVGNK